MNEDCKEWDIKPTNPWFYAGKNDFITPENIDAAKNAGADKLELLEIVMTAISLGQCEDVSGCAFVAAWVKKDQ